MPKPLPTPVSGQADWREYRCLLLDNGVTVCLVHDKESKTTAAAATVQVGASADPIPGLAHFCEHMVFLGSEKYPGENDYKSYLSQHGGRSNASTSMFTTTFKFEILAPHAEKALDMFSNFFVAPLFTESGTAREVQAVDSENSKNLVADGRRRLQVLKSIADPSHYYAKFSTGHSGTLPTTTPEEVTRLRDCLLAFHAHHYCPGRLTVVVAGPQSLDELEAWTVPRFAPMQPRTVDAPADIEKMISDGASEAPPFGFHELKTLLSPEGKLPFRSPFGPQFNTPNDQWPALITTKPVRSMRRLILMFPLPPVHNLDQSPSSVLSHLLGHEGPGSSFAILQNAGLLSSLSAGPRTTGPDFGLFQVSIGLTEAGELEWKSVVDVILQHCRLIAKAASTKEGATALKRIWGESSVLNSLFFQQASPGGVYGLAPQLANSILMHGTLQCLAAGRMLNEDESTFPLSAVTDFADRLTVPNLLIERCSLHAWEEMENAKTEKKTEKWYSVDYFMTAVTDEDVVQWKKGGFLDASKKLKLPDPNRFVPENLALCKDLPEEATKGPRIEMPADPPNLVIDDEGGRLWHRLDDRYALPKSCVHVLFRNAAIAHCKRDGKWLPDEVCSVYKSILSGMFSEALAQDTYDAELAGLHWDVSFGSSGIQFQCSGFSDRLGDLARTVIKEFYKGDFLLESHFQSTKDRVVRSYKTYFESRRADSHAIYYRDFLLAQAAAGIDKSVDIAEEATLDTLKGYFRRILDNDETNVDCFFTGNVSEEGAKEFFRSLRDVYAPGNGNRSPNQDDDGSWVPSAAQRALPAGRNVDLHFASKNKQEENGAVLVSFQSLVPGFRGCHFSSSESLQSTASIRLLCTILREPLFDELRTKQTLGYIVSSYYDFDMSSPPDRAGSARCGPTLPIDYIVVNVLSRKVSPPEVAQRIEKFLQSFRHVLDKMPDSEIDHHAAALSTKMLKPFQKLGDESHNRFSKIRRYASEVLQKRDAVLPWDSTEELALQIKKTCRKDLLATWDRMIHPGSRSMIRVHVYGSTFPLAPSTSLKSGSSVAVNDLAQVVRLRKRLPIFGADSSRLLASPWFVSPISTLATRMTSLSSTHSTAVGVATLAVMGAVGMYMMDRGGKTGNRSSKF